MNKEAHQQIVRAVSAMQQSDECYFAYAGIVWDALDTTHRDALKQLLFQGPVYDGCVLSKAARDDLIDFGLATRCCFMGEQGYTTATYAAYTVVKAGKGGSIARRPGTPDTVQNMKYDPWEWTGRPAIADSPIRQLNYFFYKWFPRSPRWVHLLYPPYECENCIGMIEHGCWCHAYNCVAPNTPREWWRKIVIRLSYKLMGIEYE